MTQSENNLIWLDLEMTGLDLATDRIIEMAVVVTDSNLNMLAESPVLTLHQDEELMESMDEWCTKQHGKSGLTKRVKHSEMGEAEAENIMLEFISQWSPQGTSPMCGNTIHQDRRFLDKYMSKFESYFHYRNLDVSTLKILAQRWAPQMADGYKKESEHLALADIRDSIDELKYYREHFLRL